RSHRRDDLAIIDAGQMVLDRGQGIAVDDAARQLELSATRREEPEDIVEPGTLRSRPDACCDDLVPADAVAMVAETRGVELNRHDAMVQSIDWMYNQSMGRLSKREERRAQIVAAFARVLAEHGYAGATIAAVAAEAEVAPGLVHHYFAGKAELLATLL